MIKIAPSILAADPLRLYENVKNAINSGCDELHFDVMDGHFVPNISFGPHILQAMKKEMDSVYDVHLMLSNPLDYIEAFINAGADIVTVHHEANNPKECIKRIHTFGKQAGISIKPNTPVSELIPYFDNVDRILIMTVEPGFGGQKLIQETLVKMSALRELGFKGDVEADGGITETNAQSLVEHGCNILVMGTSFFANSNQENLCEYIHSIKS